MTTEQQGQHSDAVKIDMLLRQVVTTPEGSTAMFVNFYCTDKERLEDMKSNFSDVLYNMLNEKCSKQMLKEIKKKVDTSHINLLQNESNHWHIVLPPRNEITMDLPDDYLEKVNAGEILAAMFYVGLSNAFLLGSGAAAVAFGTGVVALIAGGVALGSLAVGAGVTVGALAAMDKI